MPSIRLTPTRVDQAQPAAKMYELRDTKTPGLILRVRPSGRKYYVVEYARKQFKTVGRAGPITLETARINANKWLAEPPEKKPKGITVRQFIDEHYAPWAREHLRAPEAALLYLRQFEGLYNKRLDEVTAWHVQQWRKQRLKTGIMPSTVNRYVRGTLKPLFTRAVEWGYLSANPLSTVKPVKETSDPIVRYLSDSEETRLREQLAALPYDRPLRTMVLVSLNTGLRQGELFKLKWADVDPDRRILTVRASGTKSGKTRHVPINTEATEALQEWQKMAGASDALVFPSPYGGPYRTVRKPWGELLAWARIKNFRWHDMRHHCASKMVQGGVDLYIVAEILGHSSIAMTKKYAHLAPEHLAAAVAVLDR